MTCKHCGKTQHACSGCSLTDWEWDYCNTECFMAAHEVVKNKLEEILAKVDAEVATALKKWYADNPFSVTESVLDNWLDR